ncbi:MAG: hypothetical protein ABWX96_21050, partial [Propionibacteriaceae bacterium]
MTPCTQPGCNGSIVDGYCDVCGSPGAAAASVPASAAPMAQSTRTAPVAPPPPRPRVAGTGPVRCTQPGCTGTIVDGYCDVCGTPG